MTIEIHYKKHLKARIAATLIDYSIYLFLVIIYIEFFGTRDSDGGTQVNGLMALPILIFWLGYFVMLEAYNGATPGHDICKLKIVKIDGNKLGLKEALKRRILDFIDIGFYGIPALICINNTPKYQRLGDLWAGAVVVKRTDIIETEVVYPNDL